MVVSPNIYLCNCSSTVRACVCPLNRKLLSIMRNMKATRRGGGGWDSICMWGALIGDSYPFLRISFEGCCVGENNDGMEMLGKGEAKGRESFLLSSPANG